MSIVIISSDSNKMGEEMARCTAKALNYTLLGKEFLATVASRYSIPQDRLEWALEATPHSWGRAARRQRQALASIQAAVLDALLSDHTVCYGLASHLYVVGISHALHVRILADPTETAKEISKGVTALPEKNRILMDRHRKRRQRWSLALYHLDETDASHYDLVIRLSQIPAEEAVKIIAQTVAHRRFAAMTYSIKCLRDAELASRVSAELLKRFSRVTVRADGGSVVVEAPGNRFNRLKRVRAIKAQVQGMEGVAYVEVHAVNGALSRWRKGSR